MIDRLVCADGGNPDPTSTGGKDPQKAKDLELKGWNYPRHLAGRVFSVVVHGDAAGTETLRRILTDWLKDIGMIPAGHAAELDRYVGYYEPYATSHEALDHDRAFQEETRNAARALVQAVKLLRRGRLPQPDARCARRAPNEPVVQTLEDPMTPSLLPFRGRFIAFTTCLVLTWASASPGRRIPTRCGSRSPSALPSS